MMSIFSISFMLVGLLCIISTIFAITATDQWWMRIVDYLRVQTAAISLLLLLLTPLYLDWTKGWPRFYILVLLLATLYQGYLLSPYLLPVSRTVPDREVNDPKQTFTLLTSNVKMDNRQVQPFLDLVEQYDPEVVLVIEPDEQWTEDLALLRKRYAHWVEQPQDNFYGMNLYSHLPLLDPKVHYFETDAIPSIQTTLQLSSGDEVILYGTHPRPPLPGNSVAVADRELLTIAQRVQEATRPVVVMGDLNDVPWSYTMTKFRELSGLRDLRVGRGLFNTFDAQRFYINVPIDHIYIAPGLGLVYLEEPITYSSDHKALFVRLIVDESS